MFWSFGITESILSHFCDVKNRYSVMYGEFTSTVSFCLLVTHCHDLQSAIKIIIIGNSELLIGCIIFIPLPVRVTYAIAENRPRQRCPLLKAAADDNVYGVRVFPTGCIGWDIGLNRVNT